MLPGRVAVRREDEVVPVGRPRGRAGVLEVARSHLHGRPAVHRDHEDVVEAEVQVPDPVLPALEAVLHDRRGGPVGAGGRFGSRGQGRRRGRHQHVEGDEASIGRPAESARRFEELGEGRGLAGVHPAEVDLAVRGVREPVAVAGPAGRTASREAPVVGAIGVDDPEFAALPVLHDVHRGPHVDDLAAVGRDLRVGRVFELEDVHGLEAGLGMGRDGRGQGEEEEGEGRVWGGRAGAGSPGGSVAGGHRVLGHGRDGVES